MNQQLQDFARATLKTGLRQLPEGHQLTFNRMYSPQNLSRPINDVVDAMPADQLDWAMQQVQNSLDKLGLPAPANAAAAPADRSPAPNFEAARKFLELYGHPRPGYDTTVSGMVAHLAEQGHPKAYPEWAYVTGGLLQPEQALRWLAYLLAVGPVPSAATPSGASPTE